MTYASYCRLNVSVWDTDARVVRAVHKRMLNAKAKTPALRIERHKLIRAFLKEHHDARELARQFRL